MVTGVGFEPTPPKRLVPKTSALDHSATQPYLVKSYPKPTLCYRDLIPIPALPNVPLRHHFHTSVGD
jgi:hypothetical protein